MRPYDQIIRELESTVKDSPEAARLLDELIRAFGVLEGEILQLQMEANRLRAQNEQLSWNGYVDAQSGAFYEHEKNRENEWR